MGERIPVIDDYMARELVTLTPDQDIHSAMRQLIDKRISGAPVLNENGLLVGVLTKKDCLKVAFQSSYHQDWGGRVDEFMTTDVATLDIGMSVVEAAQLFANSTHRSFPVMDHGRLVGQLSRHDILCALEALWV